MGKDTFVAPRAPTAAERRNGPDVLGAIFADKNRPAPVAISQIRTDGGTQMRAGLDDGTVFEYTQAMIASGGWGEFPAAVAYHDGAAYWLADGFHRVQAYRDAFPDASKTIPVEVRAGTRRDAILHAAGANANHGLRRTNADERRAVETLLRDEEWKLLPLREISRICLVSEGFVHKVSHELSVHGEQTRPAERTVTRNGTTYTQNTTKIGSNPAPKVVYTATEPPAAVLNTAPADDEAAKQDRFYMLVAQIEEEVRTCLPLHTWTAYQLRDLPIYIADDCRHHGPFRRLVERQLGNYRNHDVWDAMMNVATQIKNGEWSFTPATAPADETRQEQIEREWRESNAERVAAQEENGRRNEEHWAKMRAELEAAKNTAPAGVAAAVEETEEPVHQPVIYTYEEIRQTAGDHVARGVAARQPDDEAIEHPFDCYDENGAPAAGKMRDLWELRSLLQDVRDQKAREYAKLTGLEVPAVLAITLTRMVDNLTTAMDAFQAEVEATHANQ